MTTTSMAETAPSAANRLKLIFDLVATACVFAGLVYALPFAHIAPAGPFAVIGCVAFATWRLWASGEGWRLVGMGAPKHWWTIPLWVVLLYASVVAVSVLVVAQIARVMEWPTQDLSRFAFVRGNLSGLAIMLGVSWSTAAFGEEMLFRGFAMTRLEKIFGGGALAIVLAILIQGVAFGFGHMYLGARGMATAGAIGLVFAVGYYLCGRNLWPLIVAHGLTDSLSMLVLFSGRLH